MIKKFSFFSFKQGVNGISYRRNKSAFIRLTFLYYFKNILHITYINHVFANSLGIEKNTSRCFMNKSAIRCFNLNLISSVRRNIYFYFFTKKILTFNLILRRN